MRKLIISVLLILGAVINANAAQSTPRGRGGDADVSGVAVGRSSTRANVARSATVGRTTVARSAQTSQPKTVAARAAITQKVINSGTKVAAAAKNVAVNEECQNK